MSASRDRNIEQQNVRLVSARAAPLPATAAPRSAFERSGRIESGRFAVVKGAMPPPATTQGVYAGLYTDLGAPGTILKLPEAQAATFKRWAREHEKTLEYRRTGRAEWTFRRPDAAG